MTASTSTSGSSAVVDAVSFPPAAPAAQVNRPTEFDASLAAPDAAMNNSHVQVWMAAMKASAKTADAVLNLQVGGLPLSR